MGKFQGAGEISIAKRNLLTGKPSTAFRSLGCVDVFDPKFTIEKGTPHIERCSGQGQIDYQGIKSRGGSLDLTFTEWNMNNIIFMFNGTKVAASGEETTDEDEVLPEGIEAGDSWHLGADGDVTHQAITGDLGITDAASPAAPLVEGTHYLLDRVYGTLKFIDVDGFTQPFVVPAGYGYTNKASAVIFTAPTDEYFIRVNSKNVAQSLAKGIVELYRGKFDPPASVPLINDDFTSFAISATLYQDQDRANDSEYGQFGRVIPDLT